MLHTDGASREEAGGAGAEPGEAQVRWLSEGGRQNWAENLEINSGLDTQPSVSLLFSEKKKLIKKITYEFN